MEWGYIVEEGSTSFAGEKDLKPYIRARERVGVACMQGGSVSFYRKSFLKVDLQR